MPAPILTGGNNGLVTRTRQGGNAAATLSFSINVPSGSNFLIVAVSAALTTSNAGRTGPTFGGAAMTHYMSIFVPSSYYKREIFYLVNPPVGTNTFTVNYGTMTNFTIGGIAAVFSNVDTSSPIVNYASGNWSGYTTVAAITSDPEYYVLSLVTAQDDSGFDNQSTSCNYTNYTGNKSSFEDYDRTYTRGFWHDAGGKTGTAGSNTITWSQPLGTPSGSNPYWHNFNIRGKKSAQTQVIWFM